MPIVRCKLPSGKSGWGVQNVGKCFPTKKQAVKQYQAILISKQKRSKAMKMIKCKLPSGKQGFGVEGDDKCFVTVPEALKRMGALKKNPPKKSDTKKTKSATDKKSNKDKVQITIVPADKSVAVSVNGTKLEHVSSVFISTESAGYFGVEIAQREKVGDLQKVTRIIAEESDNISEKKTAESSVAGFRVVKNDVKSDVADYLRDKF